MPRRAPVSPSEKARLSDRELPELDRSIPPWPGRHVAVGGARVFIRTTPPTGENAEPALYVHGLGGASTNWTDLAAQLSPWLSGEAIDLLGFGRSGPSPDDDYSLRAQARVVIGYLENAGRGPVHLFGNSMGGAISILVASSRPDLVRTLTLISPAVPALRPNRTPGADPRLVLLAVPGVGGVLQRKLELLPPAQRVRGTLKLVYGDFHNVPQHRIDEAVAELEGRGGMEWAPKAFVAALRSIAANHLRVPSRSMWTRMGQITAPTLLVWGDQDRLVDVRLAERTRASIPGARLIVLPGIGHVAMMEDPQTTARAVLGLLEDNGSAAGGQAEEVLGTRVESESSGGPVGA
jgi:pimeloyl-ACP methyl ester carboxylesterase